MFEDVAEAEQEDQRVEVPLGFEQTVVGELDPDALPGVAEQHVHEADQDRDHHHVFGDGPHPLAEAVGEPLIGEGGAHDRTCLVALSVRRHR